MKISLSKKEIIFLMIVLKKFNLYGLEYDSKIKERKVDIKEEDIPSIKESLKRKLYINVINEQRISVDENIHYIFTIWENSEKTITVLKNNSDIENKQFIFIYDKYMVTMEKIWGEYYLELFKDKNEINNKLSKILNLNDNNNDDDLYNISMSPITIEALLRQYGEKNIDNVNKMVSSLGLSIEVGNKILGKMNMDDSRYKKAMVINKNNKSKSAIKIISDNDGNFMFKQVNKVFGKKIVLVRHTKEEIIKSILV